MDVGSAFVTHRETAEAIEPGQGALDDQAMATQAFTRLDAASGDAAGMTPRVRQARRQWG